MSHRPVVLVAEDELQMRALVTETLRKDGYDVRPVADGGRLLVSLARRYAGDVLWRVVDLVVSDIRMPICTGLQILEQMRAAHWRTPVILMTAFGDDATRSRARSLGALLFDKPFALDDLRTAAARLLACDA
jgi:DNA-binding response OmpR family regulator